MRRLPSRPNAWRPPKVASEAGRCIRYREFADLISYGFGLAARTDGTCLGRLPAWPDAHRSAILRGICSVLEACPDSETTGLFGQAGCVAGHGHTFRPNDCCHDRHAKGIQPGTRRGCGGGSRVASEACTHCRADRDRLWPDGSGNDSTRRARNVPIYSRDRLEPTAYQHRSRRIARAHSVESNERINLARRVALC
jgi:hypothetical protein